MALDPLTIQVEREKLQQFQVEGVITSSKLTDGRMECLRTYRSHLKTEEETIEFTYRVNNGLFQGSCTYDSIYEVRTQPFTQDTLLSVNLTEETPHRLIYSDSIRIPTSSGLLPSHGTQIEGATQLTTILFLSFFVLIVGLFSFYLIKRRKKRRGLFSQKP